MPRSLLAILTAATTAGGKLGLTLDYALVPHGTINGKTHYGTEYSLARPSTPPCRS